MLSLVDSLQGPSRCIGLGEVSGSRSFHLLLPFGFDLSSQLVPVHVLRSTWHSLARSASVYPLGCVEERKEDVLKSNELPHLSLCLGKEGRGGRQGGL